MDLESLLLRESSDGNILPGAVPSVVYRLITEVESRGLTEIGICEVSRPGRITKLLSQFTDRLAGAHSEVNALKEALNKGQTGHK